VRRFGLSQRVILGSLFLSLFVIIVMGYTLRRLSGVLEATAHLRAADDIFLMGSQVQDDLLELFQTQETFDQYLSEQTWRHYFEFSRRVETLLDRARDLRQFRKQTQELDHLDQARMEMSDLLQNATYTINPNFPIGAVSAETLAKIRGARARLHQQIRAVLVKERDTRKILESLLRQQIDSMRQIMAGVVGLVFAGGVIFAFYLNRSAMAPLKNLMDVMRKTEEIIELPLVQPSGAPEMRELIETFNHMNVNMMRNQKRLSSMLSLAVTVAHEVRNPIAAIGTAIQAIQAGYPKDGPDKEIFGEILKEVYRVNAIISDLLVFARPRPLSLEKLNWSEFMDEIRILTKPWLEEKSIVFRLEIFPGAETITADKNQLHRVFLNLLNNALDAVVSKGEIRVEIKPFSSEKALLIFEDSGPGIPEADHERVFDAFFSTKTKGTGLGLAIVSDIIERHGGTIRVFSGKILKGARFEIELPFEPESVAEAAASRQIPSSKEGA